MSSSLASAWYMHGETVIWVTRRKEAKCLLGSKIFASWTVCLWRWNFFPSRNEDNWELKIFIISPEPWKNLQDISNTNRDEWMHANKRRTRFDALVRETHLKVECHPTLRTLFAHIGTSNTRESIFSNLIINHHH